MVPGGGLGGISGIETGNAAALVSVLPGADVQELPGVALPSADAGVTVAVVLPVTEPSMITGIAVGKVSARLPLVVGEALEPDMLVMAPNGLVMAVGLAGALLLVEVTLSTDGESSTSVGEQFTLVPGSVGSSASGGEAKVVAGAPGIVAAEKRLENGLGPDSGDDTIAPGVVAIPMAVVPMVETCAGHALPLIRSATVTQRSVRIQGSRRWIIAATRKQRERQTQLTFRLYWPTAELIAGHASMLHMHCALGRRHKHIVIQVGHDRDRANDHHEDDEQAKGERENVVGAVWPAGDMQEEDQVNAHLGDGEDRKAEAHTARPEQRRVRNPERRRRQDERHQQADGVDQRLREARCPHFLARDVSWSAIVSNVGHGLTPIR
jgi:hypothetical protein